MMSPVPDVYQLTVSYLISLERKPISRFSLYNQTLREEAVLLIKNSPPPPNHNILPLQKKNFEIRLFTSIVFIAFFLREIHYVIYI